MLQRAQGVVAYVALFASCVAGMLHLGWWLATAAACVLALISLFDTHLPYPRYSSGGTVVGSSGLLLSSLLNAGTAASAAFVLGRAISWFWGL